MPLSVASIFGVKEGKLTHLCPIIALVWQVMEEELSCGDNVRLELLAALVAIMSTECV